MNRTNTLEIENLNVRFPAEEGSQTVVKQLRLRLAPGESLGIVGESGSGKSMTALAIMGLVPAPGMVSGDIRYWPENGAPMALTGLPPEKRPSFRGKEIAMIFQEPMTALNPVFRCGEQIAEAIQTHLGADAHTARTQSMEWLKKVQLDDPERMFHAYPHELSGGQKQRILVAMALCCCPKILIADEPTTALDVTTQKAILQLIKDLQTELGMALLFISHDLGVIAQIADRVLVMHKGRVVETGPVRRIFQNPAHPYTKGLLACRPPLSVSLRRLPVMSDFLEPNATPDGQDQMKGKPVSFSQIIDNQTITPQEQAARRAQLYARPPLFRVEQLRKWYPTGNRFWGRKKTFKKAVDGVSFEIFEGETLGLVGQSGCGKTTLGRTLLRLTNPTGGQFFFNDQNLFALPEHDFRPLRKQFQIIFQDPYAALNPRQPIGQALLEPMRIHRLYPSATQRRERAVELLETVGLQADHFYRMPHEFSGGQRQRICIARALATQPRFVVCDECVSALDVSVQAQILNLLVELREKHKLTLLFISHDLSVIRFMSDRMLVMNEGKIVETGTPESIFENPASHFTRQLIDAVPQPDF
ncbi:MAG: ABC transporter ATP-binding protein [Bacteroidetes bacterium]|nr:MAG: ABC transporter ATP-binding protein [Bacteroidota bacterium]